MKKKDARERRLWFFCPPASPKNMLGQPSRTPQPRRLVCGKSSAGAAGRCAVGKWHAVSRWLASHAPSAQKRSAQ